ncbi:endoribonuclease L-PSP [Fusarium oxysporum f. sp. melonis 26406]|uniref:Endoribonuclease L-PSP n=1 Tax=Fusarium oxysporum f. sp. melonis 26406 TaxID=1089452 RepID=W9ZFV5_FUSOX|nr:endoribonuclease L-PSP [Fusarium oxysporum f. sp. melonis 26406]
MAPPQAVKTASAPAPLPQFSQAIKYNGMVYCSGGIGILPGETFVLVEGTVKDRARQIFKNITAVLDAAGSSLQNLVKMNIYLTDMANFTLVNEAYDEFFTWKLKPVSYFFSPRQVAYMMLPGSVANVCSAAAQTLGSRVASC